MIEIKIADAEEGLQKRCKEALRQIEDKQYAKKIERNGFRQVICYGITFYKKECLVEILKENEGKY